MPNRQLVCRQINPLCLDVDQIYPFFIKNQETGLGEDHLGGSAVDEEFSNEGAFGVPYVYSFPTP